MVIDISILVLLLISCILGARKGFTATIASLFSWFACTIAGFILFDKVKMFIVDKTPVDDILHDAILKRILDTFIGTSSGSELAENPMPDLFGNIFTPSFSSLTESTSKAVNNATMAVVDQTATTITGILLSIASFVLIILAFKLVTRVIMLLFSKKHNGGVRGFVDGLLGFMLGAIRGIIYIFIFLSVLVPVLTLINPDFSQIAMTDFHKSMVGDFLYQNNILLMVLKGLFTGYPLN